MGKVNNNSGEKFSNLNSLKNQSDTILSIAENIRALKKTIESTKQKGESHLSASLFAKQEKQKLASENEKTKQKVAEEVKVQNIVEPKTTETKPASEDQSSAKRVYIPTSQFNRERPRYNNQDNRSPGNRPYQNNSSNYQGNRPYQNNAGGYQGNRPYYNNQGGTQGYQGGQFGQGGFQRRPNQAGFQQDRPYGNTQNRPPYFRGPNLKPKTDLEPLPDFIKSNKTFDKKKKDHDVVGEKKTLSLKQKMRFGIIEDDSFNEERMGSRKLKLKKEKNSAGVAAPITNAVIRADNLTVKSFSETISRPVNEIIKTLMDLGLMMTINSSLDYETAELVASVLGVTLERKVGKTFEEIMKELHAGEHSDKNMEKRPPVVTVMGHVDHGKTSLLDAIRKTNVISGEAGGITQHIGAYQVNFNGEKITFVDTPGHAAFSAMRARGAQITDIAILVVAANDGIMPQTAEAIKHIQSAKVPMIVAINKMDLIDTNPDRIKQQLTEYNITPEEWGGDVPCIPISAKTGAGLDKLMEMILVVSEVAELKANPKKDAEGVVIEAKLDKNRGSTATLLIQSGTLKLGDALICGTAYGKVRAMFDENGNAIKKAGPSAPVSVLGLDDIPSAGDYFCAVDEKLSRQVIEERKSKIKQERIKKASTSLDDFYARVDDNKLKHLNIIIKSDVQGSAEALEYSLIPLSNEEVRVVVINSGAGVVNENDILMAGSSNAIIIAFNIKVDSKVKAVAEKNKVEIKNYKIIYEAIDEITKIVKSMKEPKYKETYLGKAEVRVVFKLTSGTIAGCYVLDGSIKRNAKAKILRKNEVLLLSTVEALKIQKDDKKEVNTGYECGIKIAGFTDFIEGDIIECFNLEKIEE